MCDEPNLSCDEGVVLSPKDDILQGWKEIAAHLGRDVRTVRRWEKQRSLPVRRPQGEGRSSVYALTADLNEWLLYTPADHEVQVESSAASEPLPLAEPALLRHAVSMPWAIAMACVLTAGAISLSWVYRHHAPTPTTEPYRSPVAGVEEQYLQAVYLYEQRTPQSLTKAQQLLEQAVKKDPQDAPAWAALSSATLMLQQYGMKEGPQAFEAARGAAERALVLDASLAEGHATLGFVDFLADSDMSGAEREFQTALRLDPRSVCAHHRYGIMLTTEGRFREALDQLNLAQRYDPASKVILASRALAMGFNGKRDEAVQLLTPVAAEQPGNPVIHARLAMLAAMQPANAKLYLEERARVDSIVNGMPAANYAKLLRVLQASGDAAMWRELLAQLQQASPQQQLTDIAGVQAQLGEKDAAFATLNDAEQVHALSEGGLHSLPLLQPLWNDPRFDQLASQHHAPALVSDARPAAH